MVEVSYIDTAVFTEGAYREILNTLSKERRERAERYRQKQAAYLSAGAGYLLSRALKEAGLEEKIFYGEHGKPYIQGFHFNLSHSGTVAVLAAASGEAGIDIEKIAPVKEELIKRVCTERECEYLFGLSEEKRAAEFFRFWTAKESAAKYLGTGLSDPKDFEADFSLKTVRFGREAFCVREYPLEGYALTACAREEFAPALKEVKAEALI